MRKYDFTFKSTNQKTDIHGVEWLPDRDDDIKGMIQIVHGMTEYINRYEAIAKFFTDHGYGVIGHDHLGHGLSVGPNDTKMYFGPEGSWDYIVNDIHECWTHTNCPNTYPNVKKPHILLGFSLGSFAARHYLIEYPSECSAAIIAGTGCMPTIVLQAIRAIAVKEGKKYGEDKTSPLIKQLTFESYNKQFQPNKTTFDWLNSNENADIAYENDPMRGQDCTCGMFREMLTGMIYTGKPENIRHMDTDTPILLLSGDNDPVGDNGKGVLKLEKKLTLIGCSHVTAKLFPGRHDILREKCSDEVLDYVLNWITSVSA